MRRRRRYEVVVEGLSGQAASHRSVLSEHRSEADAREAAVLERSRLEVIYGENAADWRVLVLRDDELVHQENPAGARDLASITGDIPIPQGIEEPAADAEADSHDEGAPEDEAEAAPSDEPLPEGPVPDWVLAKFEESIARRGDREDTSEPED